MHPEEVVRTEIIAKLVESGFPKNLMSVERKVPGLRRRLDLLCYGLFNGEVRPLLLVECKAVKLTRAAERQVAGYNYYVGAPFVAIVNAEEMLWGECGRPWERGVPAYEDLWNRFTKM